MTTGSARSLRDRCGEDCVEVAGERYVEFPGDGHGLLADVASVGGGAEEPEGAVVDASVCDPTSYAYIVGYNAYEIDFDLYRVEMFIELEPGMEWTALFTVDFATSDFPTIVADDPDSAAMLCL